LRHSACFELLFVTIGLNYKESNADIRETAAILDAILNFSKCSGVTKVHPVDCENRPPGLPKTIKKKTYTDISRFNPMAPGLSCDLQLLPCFALFFFSWANHCLTKPRRRLTNRLSSLTWLERNE